jgi:hypothetical protein
MRNYVIEEEEPFSIYSYPDGQYICIIDKTPTTNDLIKLISRINALKNDEIVSKDITTLHA